MRTVGANMTVEHRTKAKGLGVLEKYKLIDAAVKDSDEYLPVYFDEKKHLKEPFSNSMQRHRFIQNMRLSVEIDIYQYCPGGNFATSLFVTKIPEERSPTDMLNKPLQVASKLKPRLQEFHTLHRKTTSRGN